MQIFTEINQGQVDICRIRFTFQKTNCFAKKNGNEAKKDNGLTHEDKLVFHLGQCDRFLKPHFVFLCMAIKKKKNAVSQST